MAIPQGKSPRNFRGRSISTHCLRRFGHFFDGAPSSQGKSSRKGDGDALEIETPGGSHRVSALYLAAVGGGSEPRPEEKRGASEV